MKADLTPKLSKVNLQIALAKIITLLDVVGKVLISRNKFAFLKKHLIYLPSIFRSKLET